MIDWDEVFEDVNWGRWIAIIVAGIVVAVAMVWVGMDYHRAKSLTLKLDDDLIQLGNFHATASIPGEKDMQALENEKQDLANKLDAMSMRLPVKFDLDQIKAMVKEVSSRFQVDVLKVSTGRSNVDGYCLIYPVDIAFTSNSRGALSDFLTAIQRLPVPNRMENKPILPGGVMEVTVEFYYFDEATWEKSNNCDEKLVVPTIPTRDTDLDDIVIFQGMVSDRKNKVDQELAGLVDTMNKFQQICRLSTEAGRLRTEYEVLLAKTGR
jgi:Tfp pilus assembly protein PilO